MKTTITINDTFTTENMVRTYRKARIDWYSYGFIALIVMSFGVSVITLLTAGMK